MTKKEFKIQRALGLIKKFNLTFMRQDLEIGVSRITYVVEVEALSHKDAIRIGVEMAIASGHSIVENKEYFLLEIEELCLAICTEYNVGLGSYTFYRTASDSLWSFIYELKTEGLSI